MQNTKLKLNKHKQQTYTYFKINKTWFKRFYYTFGDKHKKKKKLTILSVHGRN